MVYLDRRTVLKGLFGGAVVTVALPPLEAMLSSSGMRFADGATFPLRYGVWWWGNGVRREHWLPTTVGHDFDLKEETQPFAAVKDHMTILSGFNLPSNENVHNSGHAWLTAGHSDHSQTYHTPGSLSYSSDQIVADAWAGQTPIHSLQLGVSRMGFEGSETTGDISWAQGGVRLRAEFNPQHAFDRLFMGMTDPEQPDTRPTDTRASVLDAVLGSSSSLMSRLGTTDRHRLDEHLTAIRDLEQRIQSLPPPTQGCSPVRPTATGTVVGQQNSPEPLAETHEAMAEIVRLAFLCDRTRVFSMQFMKAQGATIFPEVGDNRYMHDITHDGPQTTVHSINVVIMNHFAKICEKLAQTPYGDRDLLHYSLILGTSEVSEGSSHGGNNMPMVLFGRAGGVLQGNQHYAAGGISTSSAILTAIRAVGVNASSFGANEGMVTEHVTALVP